MRKIIAALFIVLFLAGFAWSVWTKEEQSKNGDTLIVRLAPRDPRAFLLGDYMAVNYALNREVDNALLDRYPGGDDNALRPTRRGRDEAKKLPRDGVAIVRLDASKVAEFVRLDDGNPLRDGEHRLYFRVRKQGAQIAAQAFYFQEGYAKDYDDAKYGELRVDADGKSLLVHLLDAGLQRIQPKPKQVKETQP
ncbi:MAG: GDYXXLXY domain-containing protein [Desulfobulbaceae bacterium]|jgi:uncharacterized membrane-anchored protein|nr:GDYXXLXY domain-containing protein [Desulfobulbaceae bacterium]